MKYLVIAICTMLLNCFDAQPISTVPEDCFTKTDEGIVNGIKNEFERCVLPFQMDYHRKATGKNMTDEQIEEFKHLKEYYGTPVNWAQ